MAVMREYVYDRDRFVGVERFAAAIERAVQVVERDEAEAALLLDGLPRDMLEHWYMVHGRSMPDPARMLVDLEKAGEEEISWRLRLAMRAPDVDAKLVHCRDLFSLLFR